MMQAMRILAVCGVWLLGCAGVGCAQQSGLQPGDGKGLYSDDEQELLEYLADHDIPARGDPRHGGAIAHPGIAWERKQVARAFELFESGSAELRLAIAKSLWWGGGDTYGPAGSRFWEACGPEDHDEVRYYLFGLALGHATDDGRTALRRWLFEDADLEHADALLKNISAVDLFAGTSAAQQDEMLAFLKRLYKQQGVVVRTKGPDEETTVSGSVQEYVVRLLPKTEPGWDLLIEWMAADSKTADDGTLRAMWGQWRRLCNEDARRHLKTAEFYEAVARNSALAESWCLSPSKAPFPARFYEARRVFEQNVWRQVFNDDERVRHSIITSLLRGSGRWDKTQTPEFLRSVEATAQARTQATAAAREIYDQLMQLDEYAEGQRPRTWLDERFQALNAALEPE